MLDPGLASSRAEVLLARTCFERAEQDPCSCSARSARSRLLETFVPYKIMFYIFDSIKLFRIQSCSYIGLKVCSIQIYLFISFSNGFVRYIMMVWLYMQWFICVHSIQLSFYKIQSYPQVRSKVCSIQIYLFISFSDGFVCYICATSVKTRL